MKTKNWNGHEIRFIEQEPGDWWAVLSDVAKALGLSAKRVNERISKDVVSNDMVDSGNGHRKMLIVNEYGIYETVFESRKPQAKAFKRWVYGVVKELRQATGLEGFQAFRMMDVEHQKQAMAKLKDGLRGARQGGLYQGQRCREQSRFKHVRA